MAIFEAHDQVVDVIYRYATGIDEQDWALFRTCWTDDAATDYGKTGSWSSGDEITEFMERVHQTCTDTLHRVTNPVVWVEDGTVMSRAYVDAVLLFENGKAMRSMGRYEDEFAQVDGEWRMSRRRYRSTYQRVGVPDEVL